MSKRKIVYKINEELLKKVYTLYALISWREYQTKNNVLYSIAICLIIISAFDFIKDPLVGRGIGIISYVSLALHIILRIKFCKNYYIDKEAKEMEKFIIEAQDKLAVDDLINDVERGSSLF